MTCHHPANDRVDQVTDRRGAGLVPLDRARSFGGCALVAPQTGGGKVYLVDIEGVVAHEWTLPVRPGPGRLPSVQLGQG